MPPPTPATGWQRALATWLVIFPCVALGQPLLTAVPLPAIARAALLTAAIVPFAVFVGVPAVLRPVVALTSRAPRSEAAR